MSNRESRSTTDDHRAEGSPEGKDYPEMRSVSKTGVMPAVRISDHHGAPVSETGMLPPILAEGREDTEAQDARRTTAEYRTNPADQHMYEHTRTPSIFIIEDSTELAEIIEATLQRLDMATAHATHGNTAFKRYDEIEPDVVLLDIGLPDMTGWKLLESIKERQGASNMPKVIIITAYGDPANRLIGKLQNVHDYLIKPFTSDEVERVVLGALSSAGR